MSASEPNKSRDPLLQVSGLQTWYPITQGMMRRRTGWIQAATDVAFEIAPGETLALVGESGCGKSTVGRSILRLENPQAGEVLFEGRDLLGLEAAELRAARQHVQIIFQDPMASLDPRMRIRDQVAEGMQSFGIGANEAERTDRVAALLERVQLDAAAMNRYPHEFSGGQRQRTALARALALDPKILILDDTLSSVDAETERRIQTELSNVFAGRTVVVVASRVNSVQGLDQIVVLDEGRIVERGRHADLLALGGLYAGLAAEQEAESKDGVGAPITPDAVPSDDVLAGEFV